MKPKTLLVASLLLVAAVRGQQIPLMPTSVVGCTHWHGGTLELAICGSCGSVSDSYAVYTAPVQGTLTLRVDWAIQGKSPWMELIVSTPSSGIVFKKQAAPGVGGWCSPVPCSGTIPLISAHVLAGEKLTVRLVDAEGGCINAWAPTQCQLADVQLLPDVGFVPGEGALDTRLLATAQGSGQQVYLGSAVTAPGDLDGDGLADIVSSEDPFNEPLASVRAWSSATGALLFTSWEPPGDNDEYGEVLASPGDTDGDGVGDILVGTDDNNGQGFVISGADGHTLLTLTGASAVEGFATAVSDVGDVDLDGVPDLLVGARYADIGSLSTGAARVLSGVDGSLILELAGATGDGLGISVAGPGDVDADGLPDVAAGGASIDSFGSNAGAVRLISCGTLSLLAELPGPAGTSSYGRWLAAAGDIDGDGVGDLLAGDPSAATAAFGSGNVRAWSGATHALLFERNGEAEEHLGYALTRAGDWNGDGLQDVAIGGPYWKDNKGRVLVLAGPSGTLLKTLAPNATPSSAGELFGRSAAGGTDVNGDGRPDLLVGASSADAGLAYNAGRVYVLSGDPADYAPPTLTGAGSLAPASPLSLDFAGGPPGGVSVLVVSAVKANLPFKGGLLVPHPTLLLLLALDGAGALHLATQWPAGIPSGTNLWMQSWSPDAEALHGFVASAALQIIAP